MIKKTKQETIDELKKSLENLEELYKAKCVNWKGKTSDTNELYSEIIAELLISVYKGKKLKKLEEELQNPRETTYCRENHCNIEMDICQSNRKEEIFAKRITGLEFDKLGVIKDYQIPLKNSQDDKGVGKIDLISFCKTTNTLYLIELKYEGNEETLLRATLEIYTYSKIIDSEKLLKDCFGENNVPEGITVKPAVLVVGDCNPHKELKEMKLGLRPKLKRLAKDLNITYFTLGFIVDTI